jgi:hypothetical protein
MNLSFAVRIFSGLAATQNDLIHGGKIVCTASSFLFCSNQSGRGRFPSTRFFGTGIQEAATAMLVNQATTHIHITACCLPQIIRQSVIPHRRLCCVEFGRLPFQTIVVGRCPQVYLMPDELAFFIDSDFKVGRISSGISERRAPQIKGFC